MRLSEAIVITEVVSDLRRDLGMPDEQHLDRHPQDWSAVAYMLLPKLRALQKVLSDEQELEDRDPYVTPFMAKCLRRMGLFVIFVQSGRNPFDELDALDGAKSSGY